MRIDFERQFHVQAIWSALASCVLSVRCFDDVENIGVFISSYFVFHYSLSQQCRHANFVSQRWRDRLALSVFIWFSMCFISIYTLSTAFITRVRRHSKSAAVLCRSSFSVRFVLSILNSSYVSWPDSFFLQTRVTSVLLALGFLSQLRNTLSSAFITVSLQKRRRFMPFNIFGAINIVHL